MIGYSHLALAGALAACVAGIGSYIHGLRVGADQEQAAQKRADDKAERARQQLQGQIDASNARFQTREYARQSAVREIIHESQKVIERPVYRSVCVDADGVGLLDRAAATANSDTILGLAGDTRPLAQGATD